MAGHVRIGNPKRVCFAPLSSRHRNYFIGGREVTLLYQSESKTKPLRFAFPQYSSSQMLALQRLAGVLDRRSFDSVIIFRCDVRFIGSTMSPLLIHPLLPRPFVVYGAFS